MIQHQVGIFNNISIHDYHKSPGISNSGISLILDMPARYHYEYILKKQISIDNLEEEFSPEKEKETTAKLIGSMVHCLVLEPEKFDSIFALKPKIDGRTNEGKAANASFFAFAQGKIIITTPAPYYKALAIAESVKKNKIFQKILSLGNYKIENSLFWTDNDYNVQIRSRPDFFNNEFIVDLKTTNDASEKAFEKSIYEYGYHRQAAIGIDGFEAISQPKKHFCILAVETKAPYFTNFFRIKNEAIEQGREEYKDGLRIYDTCLTTDIWPAYPEIITDIGLPTWAQKRVS
jgi:hypothetical protein